MANAVATLEMHWVKLHFKSLRSWIRILQSERRNETETTKENKTKRLIALRQRQEVSPPVALAPCKTGT